MKIRANGIEYMVERYQKNPQLPDVVLLHGFMGSGRCFEHLASRLIHFCNPITIDLLGHGQTDGADSPNRFSLDHQLLDLQTLIRQISNPPRYLHGYSMGGRLALRFGLSHPNLIKGLILESTNFGLQNQDRINRRLQTDEKRALAIENNFSAFLDEWHQMPLFQQGISLPKERINFYHAIQRNQEPAQMAHSLRGFGTAAMPSVKARLPDIEIPVLLLAGQGDLKYAEIAQQMHKMISRSTLSIIPEAGHRVHLEHPQAFTAEIESFISKSF